MGWRRPDMMSMTRAFRNDVSAVFAALGVASFGMFIWLHYYYVAYYPKTPNPELGLVHLFRNKGSFAYVSDADLTEMSLLMIAFVVCFLVGFAIVPRRLVLKLVLPSIHRPCEARFNDRRTHTPPQGHLRLLGSALCCPCVAERQFDSSVRRLPRRCPELLLMRRPA